MQHFVMVLALRTFSIEAVLSFLSVAQLGGTRKGIFETMQKKFQAQFFKLSSKLSLIYP